ncbi:MAG TPA: hypothetical protein VM657_10595 [Sphingomonas sp.]|nr:hypothetical protein [Sphingomonas sp.]
MARIGRTPAFERSTMLRSIVGVHPHRPGVRRTVDGGIRSAADPKARYRLSPNISFFVKTVKRTSGCCL